MQVTVQIAQELRLTPEEFELIKQKLNRTPNFTELCAFSGMWSEHCSYKNSIKLLKTLPRDGGKMLVAAGEENAGLMDIGNGWGVVFKIESHNHPSALEPFQGAATGVGGIQRDIFTMGARPIASLNSLRFGKIDNAKTQQLLKGVVKGIGHYGNCFGLPTVAGEVYFEECYQTNPLVNAMSVGVMQAHKMISATAKGDGNLVMYVGSATGKDGIGGASFASANITEESVQELPAVQVGDPFQEKKLLEACLEVIETGAVVGMQDMGAAGIICSTAEMSAKGNVGMHIQLDKVPTRQKNMKAWELLLSESQERMLLVVEKGREKEVTSVFDKWDLEASIVGHVTADGILNFYMGDVLEASIPAQELVLGGGAPQYTRETKQPSYFAEIEKYAIENVEDLKDVTEVSSILKKIICLPNIASKKWIYEQYDSMVGTANASTNCATDAAIVIAKEAGKALAVTVDCNSRYVYANPKVGAMIAVAEAARNIVCSGGEPLGVTNCLNFGNPYNPEVYYQFSEAIAGMGEACRKFNTPVTGGNVSFYNQGPNFAVYPTPTIGMVGLVENIEYKTTLSFPNKPCKIAVIGSNTNCISCSEYLTKVKGVEFSPAPNFDIEKELAVQDLVKYLIANKQIEAAHDVSEGGLLTTLCEMSFENNIGFSVAKQSNLRNDAFWFGESQSRVVIAYSEELLSADAKEKLHSFIYGVDEIGVTLHSQEIILNNTLVTRVGELRALYDHVLENYLRS
jgi:phosphoribosylformylglycinamidine synthase